MRSTEAYPVLAPGVFLKQLETDCVYNAGNDELYELSPEAFHFLARCDGTRALGDMDVEVEEEFLSYCLEEGILELAHEPTPRPVRCGVNERPSLRYLMVEVTDRCNLRCRHCYLGDAGRDDLAWDTLYGLLDDFDDLGGLRLMITGGEPLLYPHFAALNDALAGRTYRAVLITNGTLLKDTDLRYLRFHEIQFSLDGLQEGHEVLRGKGTFRPAMAALEEALAQGIDVSVATVMHRRNLHELEDLGELLSGLGVSSWTLEFPVPSGRMAEHRDLMPGVEESLAYFDLEWGSGPHEGAEGYACGAHLAAVDTGGRLIKCGYYRNPSGGAVSAGLRPAWRNLPRMRPEGACAACPLLSECGGGCRFRAELLEGPGGRDPLMCARMGLLPGKRP
ncbi:MAG: radical SAM protein [Actinobacteria bacterium]|nr:radical SAM protein [Actinomycetota bacterium]